MITIVGVALATDLEVLILVAGRPTRRFLLYMKPHNIRKKMMIATMMMEVATPAPTDTMSEDKDGLEEVEVEVEVLPVVEGVEVVEAANV